MAAWDEAVGRLEDRLAEIEKNAQWGDGGGTRCSAQRPHVDLLSFFRGPNEYRCQCGQVYVKDGAGGLKEVA